MATYALTINGTSRDMKEGSWSIKETANGWNTMEFDVVSYDGTYRPALNEEVIFTEDGTRIFAGRIQSAPESGFGGHGWAPIITRISAADYNIYTDRRYVTSQLSAGTLKAALQNLVTYLTPYGISLYSGQVTGPDLPELAFDYVTLKEALDQLAQITGYVWEVTYYKELFMYLPGTYTTSYNITEDDGNVIGDLTVEPAQDDYANRVIVRFTEQAFAAWAFLSPTSIANGETITIGSTTYTWQTTLVDEADNIKIGATIDDSLTNLAYALDAEEGGTGEGTLWGTGTRQNNAAWGYILRTGMFKALARDPGDNGNTIAVSETMANANWYWEGGGATTTLQGGRDEALTNRVEANDPTEQASAIGLWEVLIDAPEVRTYDAAQAIADKELVIRVAAKTKKTITYTTESARVWPGQVQTVTVGIRNLSGTFLITDVETTAPSNIVRRRVTAQSGTLLGNRWQNDAARALGSGSGASATAVGSGGGSVTISGVASPIWFGGGEAVRTRITTASTWYRGRDGGEPILDSYLLPTAIKLWLLMIADASTGGNAQCRVVAGSGDWSNQTVVSGTVTPVTDGANWVWQEVTVTPRAGVWSYRIEMTSSVNNSEVGFRAYLSW